METLIAADNTWALWALMVSWVAVSIWAEQRYRWVSRISGPIVVMLGAVLLSNLGVIPSDAPVYDTVWTYVVPVGIPQQGVDRDGAVLRSAGGQDVRLLRCDDRLGAQRSVRRHLDRLYP